MKKIIGLILIILGIGLGLFVGIWLCLIGGIVQVIEAVKCPEGVNAFMVAVGIARILCASLAGSISAFVFIIPGYVFIVAD